MKTTIISLGGSLICPDTVDAAFLKEFRTMISDMAKQGRRFVIVAGGGNVCRQYQSHAEEIAKVKPIDLDWIGIKATKLNAELLRAIFSGHAYGTVIDDPTTAIETDKKIVIGSGWRPGCSSDKDAVLLAQNFKAGTLINMSNIDYVYDKDPKKYSDAKKIENMSWDGLINIVGDKWVPGANLPFDPMAAKLAKDIGLKVIIIGKSIENLSKAIKEERFKGTVIS